MMTSSTSAAAWPKRNLSRPAWLASLRLVDERQQQMPKPKKMLSTMPSAASSLSTGLRRTMSSMSTCRSSRQRRRQAEQDQRLLGAREQKGDADPGQRGVGQRVAQQALSAQHGEGPEHAADDAEQGRTERDVPQGVVEDEVVERSS